MVSKKICIFGHNICSDFHIKTQDMVLYNQAKGICRKHSPRLSPNEGEGRTWMSSLSVMEDARNIQRIEARQGRRILRPKNNRMFVVAGFPGCKDAGGDCNAVARMAARKQARKPEEQGCRKHGKDVVREKARTLILKSKEAAGMERRYLTDLLARAIAGQPRGIGCIKDHD